MNDFETKKYECIWIHDTLFTDLYGFGEFAESLDALNDETFSLIAYPLYSFIRNMIPGAAERNNVINMAVGTDEGGNNMLRVYEYDVKADGTHYTVLKENGTRYVTPITEE